MRRDGVMSMQKGILLFFLLAFTLSGCGERNSPENSNEEDWFLEQSMNLEERYTAYLEDHLQDMILEMSEKLEQANIAITHMNDNTYKVNVELIFSEDTQEMEQIKALAEEVLPIYFPEGSIVSVAAR